MSNSVIKTSKAIKTATSNVRTISDAFDRAREIYLATIKRAEAEYFERIKHATESITEAPIEASAPDPVPELQAPSA